MMLPQPAVFFGRGAVLPAGEPRTLIVLGAARGGTTMVARMLHDLGVFVGNELDSTWQDPVMNEISRGLYHGRMSLDDPAIERVLRSRDVEFAVWGWKFPTHLFEGLYGKARNPHMIVVFRDPVAVAGREAVSQGYDIAAAFRRAQEQLARFGEFVLATCYPCLAVSYERAMGRTAELVDALVDFAGIEASPAMRRRAAAGAEAGSPRYLAETRANTVEGMIDAVDRQVAGWLRYPHQPERRVGFALHVDGECIYRGVADRFRADLERAFNNDGHCSFAVPLPDHLLDGKRHCVSIAVDGEEGVAIGNNDTDWITPGP